MKVAIVHDFLGAYGDAERMLRVLHRMYPTAPIYTAFVNWQGLETAATHFADWEIRTTWAQRLPTIARQPMRFLPVLPYCWEALDLSAYDLVISSSGDYLSQAVLTTAATLHVSYCHTPPRSLWEPASYAPRSSWYRAWAATRLRQYDFYAAQRVDRLVTNSEGVARRIRKFYRRPVAVIPPPVKIQGDGQAGGNYYLYMGDLEARQQVAMAVAACTQLERPLWVVGTGAEQARLQALAGQTVRFLGAVPEGDRPALYAAAKALLLPQPDVDFSFTAIEALGAGVPVIACAQSGMREIVLNDRTGLLFPQPTVESLSQTLTQFEARRFFPHACIQRAEEFAESVFVDKFEWLIAQAMEQHQAQAAIAE